MYRFPSSWIRGRCWERMFCWEMEPKKGRFFNKRHSAGREGMVKGHLGQSSLCRGGGGTPYTERASQEGWRWQGV